MSHVLSMYTKCFVVVWEWDEFTFKYEVWKVKHSGGGQGSEELYEGAAVLEQHPQTYIIM